MPCSLAMVQSGTICPRTIRYSIPLWLKIRFLPVTVRFSFHGMLNLNLSNRFDVLLQTFCENLAKRPATVFTAEQVIVPSAAIKRKLMLAIADTAGVCAGVEFSFLAQWLWRQIGKFVEVPETSPFSSSVLSWRILRLLEEPGFAAPYPRIAGYLSRCDEIMRFDLACRIASLFEQYVLSRPEWLAAWSKGETVEIVRKGHPKQAVAGEDQAWQAALWRKIAEETGTLEEEPAERFLKMLETGGEEMAARLPERVHLFLEPSVAPYHVGILNRLGRWMDIELYVVNPCREYWFEIVDSRRLAWLSKRQKDLYHETGNRLLASWGKESRASLESLLARLEPVGRENDGFISCAERARPETLLSRLQDAILDLTELEAGSLSHLGRDGSLEIHLAHSRTREIEILHDQLLRRFASGDPPGPGDILVVSPDLDEIAPMIEAVFSHNRSAPQIPYVITGRKDSRINPVSRALLDLLALASSRFTAAGVIDVLMLPEIGATFGFGGDLDKIRGWLGDAGICWAIDGAHKREFGLPEEDGHSFHDGLHRLFLAYALPDGRRVPFADRLPAGHAAGTQAAGLGQLWRFVEAVRQLKRDLSHPKTAAGWWQTWHGILDAFVTVTPETLEADREVRMRIAGLRDAMTQAGEAFETGFIIARHALERALEGAGQGSVPAGVVTFAPMDSLRNLPFGHVYVIGLDDGVYPAEVRQQEFDLIRLAPRKGDCLPHETDKNVFLDLVLSAGKSLYLSCTGRNIRDNSPKPPSILIAELLEVLEPALAEKTDGEARLAAREKLLVEHPLQPFSPDYFNGRADERMVSFRSDLCDALNLKKEKINIKEELEYDTSEDGLDNDIGDELAAGTPFFRAPLAFPDASWRDVLLDDLIRFFCHPNRYLMRSRLGLDFPRKEKELASDEPFTVDRTARRRLADRLLPLYLDGMAPEDIARSAAAGNEFPAGAMGAQQRQSELMELSAFAQALSADLKTGFVAPVSRTLEFDLGGEIWRLSGSLSDVRKTGLIRYRYDEGAPRDYLAAWIEHLFLNACAPEGVALSSVWHFRDGKTVLEPYGRARAVLRDLMDIYRTGLNRPLHFFPRSAWEFVQSGGHAGKANGIWRPADGSRRGESADAFNWLAMRGVREPLDADFAALANRVFGPLLAHMKGGVRETGE
ncbi:exodeoxyribonuclease V subunit gamma [Oxalobacter paraformigenes]|nr:exodeoxyribonuclease V subunit gamma [Oxalobacter paraformigenes]